MKGCTGRTCHWSRLGDHDSGATNNCKSPERELEENSVKLKSPAEVDRQSMGFVD